MKILWAWASVHFRYWGGPPLSFSPSSASSCDSVAIIAGLQHIDGPLQVKYWGCPDFCDPCGVDAYDCEIPQILTMCVHSTWRRYRTNVLGIQTHKLVIESTPITRPKYRHKTNIKTRRNSSNHCAYFHATWCWQTAIVCSIRTCELQRHVASPRQNIDTKRMSNP